MSVLKKFKKKFISKLRRIRKHYRYKVYFPKVYSSYCTEPVQENKVLFLEMRFTKLSNSFELIYKALEESGEYDLKCSYVQFNLSADASLHSALMKCSKNLQQQSMYLLMMLL